MILLPPPIDWDAIRATADASIRPAIVRTDRRFEARLCEYRERMAHILAEGRRAFEAEHASEIKALTLTPAEMAAITPRKR